MLSLRARLLVAASFVLAAFVGLCGAALESAFRSSALEAQQEKLEGLVYAMLGAAEPTAGGLITIDPEKLPDPRLRRPQSGLDAALLDEHGQSVWQSPGFVRENLALQAPEIGQFRFETQESPALFTLSFGLRWIDVQDQARRYTIVVVQDTAAYEQQINTFRRTLGIWLVGSALLLLVTLIALQAWGLRPLRRLARELREIEESRKDRLDTRYPQELAPLADALNAMIVAERSQQTRYRNALADLAHSMKTPLAVLRGAGGDAQTQEQVSRMQHLVDYQLRRAATAGSRVLSEPIALRPLAEKITAALAKVYADKHLQFDIAIDATLRLRADQGDLYELLGNLLDNAAKYGHRRVRVAAQTQPHRTLLTVEDDGPGFPADAQKLLARGVRADTQTAGQGIGLAAVADLVQAYEGRITLERSQTLGGGRVVLTI